MSKSREHESRKLIGFATSLEPDVTYREAGSVLPSRIDTAVTNYVIEKAEESRLPIRYENANVTQILEYGLRDTRSLLLPYLHKQPSRAASLDFISHERTIQTIARLASFGEETFDYCVEQTFRQARLVPAGQSHMVSEYTSYPTSASEGCPAAWNENSDDVSPLFKKFVIWSGRIALESLIHHKIIHFAKNTEEAIE